MGERTALCDNCNRYVENIGSATIYADWAPTLNASGEPYKILRRSCYGVCPEMVKRAAPPSLPEGGA